MPRQISRAAPGCAPPLTVIPTNSSLPEPPVCPPLLKAATLCSRPPPSSTLGSTSEQRTGHTLDSPHLSPLPQGRALAGVRRRRTYCVPFCSCSWQAAVSLLMSRSQQQSYVPSRDCSLECSAHPPNEHTSLVVGVQRRQPACSQRREHLHTPDAPRCQPQKPAVWASESPD